MQRIGMLLADDLDDPIGEGLAQARGSPFEDRSVGNFAIDAAGLPVRAQLRLRGERGPDLPWLEYTGISRIISPIGSSVSAKRAG
jgi:hypothetical protein